MPGVTAHKGTLLITRPEADARTLQKRLRSLGYATRSEPMLTIQPYYANEAALHMLLTHKPQAILITSKHAVTTLAKMTETRDIPLIIAGQTTARIAIALGFKQVDLAGLRAHNLVQYVQSNCSPEAGPMLYSCGQDITLDINALLRRNGFAAESVTLYKAKAATRLSKPLLNMLSAGDINGVLFFSQRTAATYVKLVLANNLAACHRKITAFCMSEKIAGNLDAMAWKQVRIATRPDIEHMLELVK